MVIELLLSMQVYEKL